MFVPERNGRSSGDPSGLSAVAWKIRVESPSSPGATNFAISSSRVRCPSTSTFPSPSSSSANGSPASLVDSRQDALKAVYAQRPKQAQQLRQVSPSTRFGDASWPQAARSDPQPHYVQRARWVRPSHQYPGVLRRGRSGAGV